MPKLLYHLSVLTFKESAKFRTFLESPYFNRNKELVKLLQALLPYSGSSSPPDNWEQLAYANWIPNEPFNQAKFRKNCSALFKLLIRFLGQEHYRENPSITELHQVQALEKFVDTKHFLRHAEKAILHIDEKTGGTEVNDFWIKSELYATMVQHQNAQANRKEVPYLKLASDYLDVYYLIQKMKYAIAMESQTNMLGTSHNATDYRALFLLCKSMGKPEEWNPLMRAYHELLLTYTQPDQHSYYVTLKALLQDGFPQIDPKELRNLFNGVLNYCIVQMRRGEPQFRDEIGEIYQVMIDQDIIWIDGKIMAWDVINLTIYHLEKENFEWIQAFIQKSNDKLIPIQREQVTLFCNGLMAYYQERHSDALRIFNKLLQVLQKSDDVFYGLNIRIAKARLLYESNDGDLEFLLNSAPGFIKTQKISKIHKDSPLNFFRFLRRLYFISPYQTKLLTRLQDEVQNEVRVSSKKWLIQQIDSKLA